MLYYITKVLLSSVIIVAVSEISKRNSLIGAMLASLPLVSILGMIWLYIDTKDIEAISDLSKSIFWLVIPSLTMFISLPILLKKGLNFYSSLSISIVIMIAFYWLMLTVLKNFGIKV